MSRLLGLVAAAGALMIAGCSNGAAPVIIETPAPTATTTEPSASPTPTAPDPTVPSPTPTSDQLSAQELWEILPEGADIPDIRGATITARYFLELRSQVLGGDGEARRVWEALSTENCVFCASVLERSAEYDAAGERLEAGTFTFNEYSDRAFLEEYDPETAYVVESFVTDSWRTVNEDGEVVQEGPGEFIEAHMRLKLVDSAWMVDGVQIEDGSR